MQELLIPITLSFVGITPTPSILNFGNQATAVPSDPQTTDILFEGSFSQVDITAPNGAQISLDGATWVTTLDLGPTSDTTVTIFVRVYSGVSMVLGSTITIETPELPDVPDVPVTVIANIQAPTFVRPPRGITLIPHLHRYVPKYFQEKHPAFFRLMRGFIEFLELKNIFHDTPDDEADNSIYANIGNFDKYGQVENFPTTNKQVLDAFFKQYADTLDFRNQILSFDGETMRDLARYSTWIFNTKARWSSYNLFFATIANYLFNGAERGVVFRAFFNRDTDFDTQTPPDFYDTIEVSDASLFSYADFVQNNLGWYGFVKFINTEDNVIHVDNLSVLPINTGDDLFDYDGNPLDAGIVVSSGTSIRSNEVILVEYPVYAFDISAEGVLVETLPVGGKGTRPFEYQIVSKSDIFLAGNFVSNLRKNFHPAGFGFKDSFVYIVDDQQADIYRDSRTFTKRVITVSGLLDEWIVFDPLAQSEYDLDEDITVEGTADLVMGSTLTVEATRDGGATWIELTSGVPLVDGTYTVDVQLTAVQGFSGGDTVWIRVRSGDVMSNIRSLTI